MDVIWIRLLSLLYGLAEVKAFVKHEQIHTENECNRTFFHYLVRQSVITEKEHK